MKAIDTGAVNFAIMWAWRCYVAPENNRAEAAPRPVARTGRVANPIQTHVPLLPTRSSGGLRDCWPCPTVSGELLLWAAQSIRHHRSCFPILNEHGVTVLRTSESPFTVDPFKFASAADDSEYSFQGDRFPFDGF